MSMSAHPTDTPRRNPKQERIVGVDPAHGCPGTDERVAPQIGPADDGCVGAQRRAAAHAGSDELMFARELGARVLYIREYARRPAKYVIFELDAVVHRDVVLNFDVA